MSEKSKLMELATACNAGACNPHGIINSLGKCINEVPFGQCGQSVELKIIIGQIAYLIGESAGPSLEAIQAFERLQTAGTFAPVESEVAA